MSNLVLYKDSPQILYDFGESLSSNLRLNLNARHSRYRYDAKFSNGNLNVATNIKRRGATPKNLNASKGLSRSINWWVAGLKVYIQFNEYGVMLDRGQDGWKIRQRQNDSLLSDADVKYGDYKDLKKNIDKWIRNRNLKPRPGGFGREERKISKKQMAFLIRRSMLNRGMNATYWFTQPYKAIANKLPQNLIFGMHRTIDDALDNIFIK